MTDASRRHSAAAERNRDPILRELQRVLPSTGVLLEIASGTGQHAAHASGGLPHWRWHPSDPDETALASIAAWCADRPNVAAPVRLDVLDAHWLGVPATVDAIFCANMVHIAPWACSPALLRGAARHLAPQGLLITYGPYLEAGVPTSPGNLAFDADLRARDPAWGLRSVEALIEAAAEVGLALRERVAMPANNRLLVWGRVSGPCRC